MWDYLILAIKYSLPAVNMVFRKSKQESSVGPDLQRDISKMVLSVVTLNF